MKAYILKGIGDFAYEEVERPVAGKDEVIVKVMAAGICGSDIPRIYHTGTYAYPLIPGHEFAGCVVALGEGVDRLWLNKRVGVFPLIPCRECEPCRNKKYEMCRKYSYLGSRTAGGFAEYVKVPVWNLIALPDEVSYRQAAMLEPMSVAVHSFRRVNKVQEMNEHTIVAVSGLGTIGLMLAMLLQNKGVKNLLVLGNKDFQKQTAVSLGISKDKYCDVRNEDVDSWLDRRTDNRGVDVFFDCVGKNEVVETAIKHTAPEGIVMLLGNPASDMKLDKVNYWKILRNQLTVLGTWNSSFSHDASDDWHECLKLLQSREIAPEKLITHMLSFEQLITGTEMMRDKKEDYVKVMILNAE